MVIANIVPSAGGFVTLLEAFRPSGGTAPAEVLSGLLADRQDVQDVQLGRLSALVRSDEIFGFNWRNGTWIPMFQFDADGRSISLAPRSVRALLPVAWSGWTVATWFTLPNDRLKGARPIDMLTLDPVAVTRCAEYSCAAAETKYRSMGKLHEVALHR